jgi:3-deoxy-7-phosphoheptulonate synthase
MRVYLEKPRTALGWKGFLYDPYLDNSNNVLDGLHLSRKLLLDIAALEIPAATEFLDPLTAPYLSDLISWGCIGARTVTSQPHRQLASSLAMPIAFKNSVDGNIDSAINGILSASIPHTYIGSQSNGTLGIVNTLGNPYGHVVLRGGKEGPNYDPQAISYTLERLHNANLPLRLLVDCSHDNSFRRHEEQPAVFQSILHQIVEGNNYIKGLLLESHLYQGNQPLNISSLKYGVSLTDPCLDWQTTERLIKWGYHYLEKEREPIQMPLKKNIFQYEF